MTVSKSFTFCSAFLLGAATGVAGLYSFLTWVDAPELNAPSPPKTHFEEEPEQWLLPPNLKLKDIFQEPGALEIIEKPEKITIHHAAGLLDRSPIKYRDYAFVRSGKEITGEVRDKLRLSINSLSVYRMPSMCMFKPGVLLRFEANAHSVDVLFCFSCNDLNAYLDESTEASMGIGMSEIGREVFLHYLAKASPENAELQKLYRPYSTPNQ